MRLHFSLVILLCLFGTSIIAQTQHQNGGWLMLLNNTKLSEKWGTYLDVQVRSSDQWKNVKNLMFRPGVTYYVNPKNELTLGYLWNETFTHLDPNRTPHLTEHRIWEQYVHKHKISTISVTHRLRLEQRFIERSGNEDLFSQRFRYFLRFVLPLEKGIVQFEKGIFVALQNELFFNVQHKNELNDKVFDQNRAYFAAGYRFNKMLDVEIGYMNQAIEGLDSHTLNNVIQLAWYTKF